MPRIASPALFGQNEDQVSLDKLCSTIRGKLQFMDFLVRAAAADVQRLKEETDPGARIFLRQLVEMHTQTLATESENMRLMNDLCHSLESVNADSRNTSVQPQLGEAV